MALIVQKYGGSSVGGVERIREVARRIQSTCNAGSQVVVVVSARGGVTNALVARAQSLNPNPNAREMDMLLAVGEQETIALVAIALQALGIPAVSFTGAQAGIVTDLAHTRARIVKIVERDILEQLDAGKVVIVAGFQGKGSSGQVTTLGRGGSDLSAIALAAVLNADTCQIFTDVEGIYTADPRVVPDARKLSEISYEEILELAASGSQVMQARAVELAQKYGVVFEVRSSFNHESGTLVKAEIPSMEEIVVSGVAVDNNQAKITACDIPDQPGIAATVFRALGEAGSVVDMIVQNIGQSGRADLTFTVDREDAPQAEKVAAKALVKLGGGKLLPRSDVAKVSVVGVGMRSHAGVASTFFNALAEAAINVQMIGTSEIKISVVVDPEQADKAVRALHNAFQLGEAPCNS